MIGLDTNVLVRYIMQDDAKQSAQATKLIESLTAETTGFIAIVSVVELTWVLSSCYGLNRAQLVDVLEALMRTKEVVLEQAEVVWKAVRNFRNSRADFADCLIERASASAGCTQTITFDCGAAKYAGMTLIE